MYTLGSKGVIVLFGRAHGTFFVAHSAADIESLVDRKKIDLIAHTVRCVDLKTTTK